jgi:hypothetical protein
MILCFYSNYGTVLSDNVLWKRYDSIMANTILMDELNFVSVPPLYQCVIVLPGC